MRLLAVPNWSFGRNKDLLARLASKLEGYDLLVHYLESDADHNRTVTAYYGESTEVFKATLDLAAEVFDSVDLNKHVGVHPRIGALDVCPFVLGPSASLTDIELAKADIELFAANLAARHQIPVFLYEKSERGRHEADLPSLRHGGFGGLLQRELHPDFGPSRAHPELGVTVTGLRDFLIALNVEMARADPDIARDLAQRIRLLRQEGDSRFLGVRALGFPLASSGNSQVSLNVTLPDITPIDPILEWVISEIKELGIKGIKTQLIGLIRRSDLAQATRLVIRDSQIVDFAEAM